MNDKLVIDLMKQQVLPRITAGDFTLLPSEKREVPNSQNFQPIFPFPIHSHSIFEWIWCLEKEAFLQIHDKVYRLEQGDFCLLPPGELHADVYIPSLSSYQVLWCDLKQEVVSAHHYIYRSVNHLDYTAGISAAAPPFLLSLLGTLQQALKLSPNYRQSVSTALVSALANSMLSVFEVALQSGEHKNRPGKISVRVENYLNQHYHEALTLNDVAGALFVSRNYLAALYKQETGKTIGQTLRDIRMEQAKKLLSETHLSVQEISSLIGYSSSQYFSRVFFGNEGVTPGSYGKRDRTKFRKEV